MAIVEATLLGAGGEGGVLCSGGAGLGGASLGDASLGGAGLGGAGLGGAGLAAAAAGDGAGRVTSGFDRVARG